MTNVEATRAGLPGTRPLDPILVSKQQAADLLGICLRTVTSLVGAKELPCRRVGRRTLIPYAALVRFANRDHAGRKASEVR
jgi:excisionase family DNA binding protein